MMSFSSMTRAAASSSVQFKVHSSHDIGSRCRAPQKVFQFSPIRQRLGVKGAFVEAIEGGAQAGGKLLHLCDCITLVTAYGDCEVGDERDASVAGEAAPSAANGFVKIAAEPSSHSISSSRLYFAIRSLRQSDPVLICPPPMATAKSAMNGSSVSPDRCDTTKPQPASRHSSTAAMVSLTVPIWLSLMSTAFVDCSAMPRRIKAVLVTYRSSPTIWILFPRRAVCRRKPAQSVSAKPSSSETIGNLSTQLP